MTKHKWQRYWYPRENESVRSLWEKEERWISKEIIFESESNFIQLKQLKNTPCLILLGDSGLGKSFVIENSIEQETGLHTLIDLRTFREGQSLAETLEKRNEIILWKRNNDILYLYIDALDEGMLRNDDIDELLLDWFKKVDLSRLFIRITCRPELFPYKFENKLKALWGENNVNSYNLSPLFIEDIDIACENYDISSDNFLTYIKQNNMQGFIYSPVTLNFLLALFQHNGDIPRTKEQLFKLGCLELCRERKVSKPNNNFIPAERRFEVAMLLAAITVFCNKAIISYEFYGKGIFNLHDWPFEHQEMIQFLSSDAQEVLRSGLFREFKPLQYTWAHYSYAEFLAAQFLLNYRITVQQLRILILNENGNVVPQLLQTAAWLGDASSEIFELILEKDPEVICLGDPNRWSESTKQKALKQLLLRYEKNSMYGNLGKSSFYKQLHYNGIEEILNTYLLEKNIEGYLVRFILSLIKLMDLKNSADSLYTFMNNTWDSDLSNQALSIYIKISDSTGKDKLKKLLVEDSSEFFVNSIVKELYPESLSLEELVTFLVSWNSIENYKILDVLSVEDKTILIQSLLETETNENNSLKSVMLDYLIIRQAELVTVDIDILQSVLLKRLSLNRYIFSDNNLMLKYEVSWNAKIILLMFACDTMTEQEQLQTCYYWFNETELQNLIDFFLQVKDSFVKERLLTLIYQLMDPYNQDHISILTPIYCLLREGNISLKNISLNSPICLIMRELPIPSIPKRRSRWLFGKRITSKRLQIILESAQKDVLTGWPSLAIHFQSNIFELYGRSMTKSILWKNISEFDKEKVYKLARDFLLKYDSNRYHSDKSKNNSIFHYALQFIWENDFAFLEGISSDILAKFTSYITDPNFDSYDGGTDMYVWVYKKNKHVMDPNFLIITRRRNPGSWSGSRDIASRRILACWDSSIQTRVERLLTEQHLSWTAIRDLTEVMYQKAPCEAISLSNNAINNRYNGLTRYKRAIAMLSKQLDCAPDGGSELFIYLLDSVEYRDHRFIYTLLRHYMKDSPQFGFIKKWTQEQRVKLYIWIHEHSAFFSENWNDSVSRWKRALISYNYNESLKAEELLRITRILPDCKIASYYWELERERYERGIWIPLSVDKLIQMISCSESRPITTGNQMLDVLQESLNNFQKEWRYGENPLVSLLWNEQRVIEDQKKPQNKLRYSPKDENTLSDTLKYHFSKDLNKRGVTSNREVEVLRSHGGQQGSHLDIKIEIPTTVSVNKNLRVYIEVKGCWNSGLEDSIENQLIQKYMLPHNCSHGLYVIGWYNCSQWKKEWDYRAGRTPKYSLTEARRIFTEKAAVLSARYQVNIQAIVLDLSLC